MHQCECAKGSGSAHVCMCPWVCKGIGLSGLGLTSACAHVCKNHVARAYGGWVCKGVSCTPVRVQMSVCGEGFARGVERGGVADVFTCMSVQG